MATQHSRRHRSKTRRAAVGTVARAASASPPRQLRSAPAGVDSRLALRKVRLSHGRVFPAVHYKLSRPKLLPKNTQSAQVEEAQRLMLANDACLFRNFESPVVCVCIFLVGRVTNCVSASTRNAIQKLSSNRTIRTRLNVIFK